MVVANVSGTAPGFKTLTLLEKVNRANTADWITGDLTFEKVPAGQLLSLRAQLVVTSSTIVNITFDGTVFHPLNNGVSIEGVFSLPILVSKNTVLNFEHDTATQDISLYLGED